ncbi:MAG: monovalent cation/H(+) antiporter subunit G [Candidatus Omnitrophica bacterium]|nr:monovalent cation/H(+) antiporter subunit G [Candidatus Omnitrophota bacterium]MCM8807132.1 monovalent cation/H(+) antiporter subunit G [Candidatus Omnitrophota bacterium]
MIEILGWFLIFNGLCFIFFGCLGLVRMPDIYCRLQTATKCVTFGAGSILFGTFLISGFSSIGLKSILCLIFLFLNSPTASHALAYGAFFSGVKPVEKTEIEEDFLKDA